MGFGISESSTSGEFSLNTLGLVDAPASEAFDSLTRLAMRMFGVPVALISIVQEDLDRQFFLSQLGLPEPWRSNRQTPLTHSFCQHVKKGGKPLIFSDSREHPLVNENLAIPDLGVIAYLGVPISMPCGAPIGALCVIESTPRDWTDEDISTLTDLAKCVNDEISLRAALLKNEKLLQNSLRNNAMRESIARAFMAPDIPIETRFQELLGASCAALGMTSGRIVKLDCGQASELFVHDPSGQFAVQKCQMNLDALTRLTAFECNHVYFDDLSKPNPSLQKGSCANWRGCYVGTPLILDGVLHGVIEFCGDSAKPEPWNIEEFSILSVVSMFVTAHLGVFGQIATLKNSEIALLQYVTELRNPMSPSSMLSPSSANLPIE